MPDALSEIQEESTRGEWAERLAQWQQKDASRSAALSPELTDIEKALPPDEQRETLLRRQVMGVFLVTRDLLSQEDYLPSAKIFGQAVAVIEQGEAPWLPKDVTPEEAEEMKNGLINTLKEGAERARIKRLTVRACVAEERGEADLALQLAKLAMVYKYAPSERRDTLVASITKPGLDRLLQDL